jgi:type IV secretion system protein VirB4
MINLNEFRRTEASLADKLPYADMVDDGVILLKDGSFLMSYEYIGEDPETITDSDKDSITATINRSLMKLGSGYSIFQDTMRFPIYEYLENQHFPCPLAQDIDDRRKNAFLTKVHYSSRYFINFVYTIPEDKNDKMKALLIEDNISKKGIDKVLNEYKRFIDDVVSMLSSTVHIKKLSHTEQLSYIHYCITGEYHPSLKFNEYSYLDSVLATEDFIAGFKPKIGKQHIRTISVTGLPDSVFPDIFGFLNKVPVSFRWSNRFIALDEREGQEALTKIRTGWFDKKDNVASLIINAVKKGGTETVNYKNKDALIHMADTENAILEANMGAVKYGFYTSVIVLYDDNEEFIEHNVTAFKKYFNNMGFYTQEETINAADSYFGSLPGALYYNVRRPMIHTLNLACMMPLFSYYPGSKINPNNLYPKDSPALMVVNSNATTPFYFNLHVDDIGHTAIFGPTGSGKSTLLDLLAIQFLRYKNASVYYFDKGYSSYIITRGVNGSHIDIMGPTQKLNLMPFKFILNGKSELTWAADYTAILCKMQGVAIDSAKTNLIYDALNSFALENRIPSISALVNRIQNNEIREALKYYTASGTMGDLLDADEENLQGSYFTVFETTHLMNLNEKVLNSVLLYLFHWIENNLTGDPTLIILDEAWSMLKNDMFKEKIREWLKVLRKLNTAVVFATQSLTDVMNSSISDVIIENCFTKILLPNIEAKNENSKPLYQKLGLSEGHIQIISDLQKKKDYFYLSPNGKRIMNLALDDFTLKFFRSDMKYINQAREIKENFYEEWKKVN